VNDEAIKQIRSVTVVDGRVVHDALSLLRDAHRGGQVEFDVNGCAVLCRRQVQPRTMASPALTGTSVVTFEHLTCAPFPTDSDWRGSVHVTAT
jgi:hypothetical protein